MRCSLLLVLVALAIVAWFGAATVEARHVPSSLTRLQSYQREASASAPVLQQRAVGSKPAAPKKPLPKKNTTTNKKKGPQYTNVLQFPSQKKTTNQPKQTTQPKANSQKKTTNQPKQTTQPKTSSGPAVGNNGKKSYTGPLNDSQGRPLNLSPTAEPYARRLKGQFPNMQFTSGRRDLTSQCSAMASNVVSRRNWIIDTYSDTPLILAMQRWVNNNPSARTRAAIATGICGVARTFPIADQNRISRHVGGDAFDVQRGDPALQRALAAIVTERGSSRAKFLTNEGGLEIWHLQFM